MNTPASPSGIDPGTILRIFIIVSGCALIGMVLGGGFGAVSGYLAPTLFTRLIPWENLNPVGTATVLGATVGVLLGGGLGGFGVLIALVYHMTRTFRSRGD